MKTYTTYVQEHFGEYGLLITGIGIVLAVIMSFYVLSRKRTRRERKVITSILLLLNCIVVALPIYGLKYLGEDPLDGNGLLAVWISAILINAALFIQWKLQPQKDWQRIAIYIVLLFGMIIFTLSFILSYIFPINRLTGSGILAI